MYEARFPNRRSRPAPGDRFRCRGCQRFVHARDAGLCPHCGLAPVAAPELPPPRARRSLRAPALWIAGAAAVAALWLAS